MFEAAIRVLPTCSWPLFKSAVFYGGLYENAAHSHGHWHLLDVRQHSDGVQRFFEFIST
jgi:hypothetical protein